MLIPVSPSSGPIWPKYNEEIGRLVSNNGPSPGVGCDELRELTPTTGGLEEMGRAPGPCGDARARVGVTLAAVNKRCESGGSVTAQTGGKTPTLRRSVAWGRGRGQGLGLLNSLCLLHAF